MHGHTRFNALLKIPVWFAASHGLIFHFSCDFTQRASFTRGHSYCLCQMGPLILSLLLEVEPPSSAAFLPCGQPHFLSPPPLVPISSLHPCILSEPRHSLTLIHHLGPLPYALFSSLLGILNTPWSSPWLHFHMTLHACMQHPSTRSRMLTRSLTQHLHVVIKFVAFDELPCSDKGFGHICTARRNEERGRKRGEDRMEAEKSAVNASERPSAPTGSFITAVRDVISLFWL